MTDCPACAAFRLHTPAEWAEFHPLGGHGCVHGRWTHPEAERLHNEEAGDTLPITIKTEDS